MPGGDLICTLIKGLKLIIVSSTLVVVVCSYCLAMYVCVVTKQKMIGKPFSNLNAIKVDQMYTLMQSCRKVFQSELHNYGVKSI